MDRTMDKSTDKSCDITPKTKKKNKKKNKKNPTTTKKPKNENGEVAIQMQSNL